MLQWRTRAGNVETERPEDRPRAWRRRGGSPMRGGGIAPAPGPSPLRGRNGKPDFETARSAGAAFGAKRSRHWERAGRYFATRQVV